MHSSTYRTAAADDVTALLTLFQDAVHYDRFRSPFTDNFSQFSVAFLADGPVGLGPLYPRAMDTTRFILDLTLQWCLKSGRAITGIHRQQLRSHPWLADEESRVVHQGVILRCAARHVFVHERRLRTEFRIENTDERAVSIEPIWQGVVSPDRRFKASDYAHATFHAERRESFVVATLRRIEAGLRVRREPRQMPQAAVRITALTDGLTTWIGREPYDGSPLPATGPDQELADPQKPVCYAFIGKPVALAPGASIVFAFQIDYSPAWHRQPDFRWDETIETRPMDELIVRARDRLAANIGLTTTAPGITEQQLLRARLTLLRCGYRGMDGLYGDRLACLCTAGFTGLATLFFWDALFSSVALSAFHPQYAKDTIRVILSNPSPTGALDHSKNNYRLPDRNRVPQPQGPIASWAVDQYLRMHNDEAFLREIYPSLCANHEFWTRQDHDGDGLAEWSNCGLISDDSPLFDPYGMGPHSGNFFLPPIASVSLNSFLHKDAMLLAAFAERLGRPEEAAQFRDGAARRYQKLMDVCFDGSTGRFWDYDHHLGVHRKVNTFHQFWPIMWDLPLTDKVRAAIIENSLLDPCQYFGAVPFPSVAYNDPCYDPEGYWRGRAWPHISYWLVAALWRCGYQNQADTAAGRILSWQSRHSGHRENMCTDAALAESCDASDFSWRTGRDFEYNWSAACVALLIEGRYRQHA